MTRKRFVTTIITALLTLICALGFTACADGTTEPEEPEIYSVAGKTFVFYDATYTSEIELDEEEIAHIEQQIERIKSGNEEVKIVFGTDNTFTMTAALYSDEGTYTQDGAVIVLTVDDIPQEFTLSGEMLKTSFATGNIVMTQYYKLVK